MEDEVEHIEGITVFETLGAKVAAISYEDIDARGRSLIQTAFVDTLGVSIAGADFDGVRIARAAAAETRPTGSLILGTNDRASALDAALLNGIAAHALDYDDGNSAMGGHPSAVLVPAILALGEAIGASGRDAAVGYAAGYEVIIRLSRALNPGHYQQGWHPTSTIGVFGAAAAAARMLDLTGAETAVALALAASMASGIKANFGSMTKSLHVGHAARNGLVAARLAAGGFTSGRAALEGGQGFLNVYNGAGRFTLDRVLDKLDQPLEVNRNVNPIKAFPCCASTHSSILAALELRERHAPDLGAIETIDIVVDRNRMPHTDRPQLDEALSGKFSLQYVVARALKDGVVGLEAFDGEAHRDPEILALMRRTRVTASEEGPPNHFAADVSLGLNDCAPLHVHAERVGAALDAGQAPEGLWTKFADCAARGLDPDQVQALTAALEAFPESVDVRSLMLLTVPGAPADAAYDLRSKVPA